MQKVEAYLKMIISTYSSISPCKSKNASAWHLGLAIFLSVVWQAIGIAHITEKTFKLTVINTLASGRFWDFEKKHRNARGFARKFLQSHKCYGPGWSVKRRGKSSSLHSKKIFLVGGADFLWVTS